MLVAILSVFSAPASAAHLTTCTPAPSAAPGPIPADAADCDTRMNAFASLAWQIFKMIAWPAAESLTGEPRRGKADTFRSLADMRGPRVFETFKADWETFLPPGAEPLPWSKFPDTAAACHNHPKIKPGTLVLFALAEFGNIGEQAGDNQSGQNITNVLVAQNGKLARYLVGFDRNEFHLIRQNKLYDAISLPAKWDTKPGDSTKAPDGTIIVKSAWIELDGLNVDRETFYHRRALVQDLDSKDCHIAEVGLVGLHIRYKTPQRPQWVWASFEHVRNVPSQGGAAPVNGPTAYTFNNGKGGFMSDQPPPETIIGSDKFSSHPAPFNVTRLKPISDTIQVVNAQWQAALACTVWANYQLVIVEWPVIGGSPDIDAFNAQIDPPAISDSESNLLNTTMETFLQSRVGPDNSQQGYTCMGCHNKAWALDYVFAIPLNARPRHMAQSPSRQRAIDYLRSLITRP
jgi:hypothetical protein